MKNESKLTESDLEDIAFLFEGLVKRLPSMTQARRIDVAARLRVASKHIESVDEAVKKEIKKTLKHKEGYVKGTAWKAKLTLVPTTRFNQALFKQDKPEVFEDYCDTNDQERITFEPRG